MAKKCLGDSESAMKLLNSSEYWAKTKNEVGIVNFNKFLIYALDDNIHDAVNFLNISLQNNNDIYNYLTFSSIVKDIVKQSSEIHAIISKLSETQK